jgi:DNA transposition AAA+ family ATPase
MIEPTRTPATEDAFISKLIEEFVASDYAADILDTTAGFMPTSGSKLIVSRLKTALEQGMSLALVHGPAGVGKSVATKVFVERYATERRAMHVRSHPDFSPSALLDEIAIGLRMTRVSRFRTLLGMVREALERQPSVIVIDEAQLCGRSTLECIKYLSDETKTMFVLVTTDEFVNDVRRWRDIESRIGMIAGITALSKTEFADLYADSGFSKQALTAIHDATDGVLRDVQRLITQLDKFVEINASRGTTRTALGKIHILEVAKKVNLTGSGQR